MHKLESPHILKFHDWYETRNNLWLILEYCTGADLESLLKQDGHLPEASVRMFGLDIVAALKVNQLKIWILHNCHASPSCIWIIFFLWIIILCSTCTIWEFFIAISDLRIFLLTSMEYWRFLTLNQLWNYQKSCLVMLLNRPKMRQNWKEQQPTCLLNCLI